MSCPAVRMHVTTSPFPPPPPVMNPFPRPSRDVTPELDRLRIKAITKCRDFLFGRFWDFRRPRTNIQVGGSMRGWRDGMPCPVDGGVGRSGNRLLLLLLLLCVCARWDGMLWFQPRQLSSLVHTDQAAGVAQVQAHGGVSQTPRARHLWRGGFGMQLGRATQSPTPHAAPQFSPTPSFLGGAGDVGDGRRPAW